MSERAYAGALADRCTSCGAAPGDYCTRADDYGGVHTRRIPCVTRVHPDAIEIDDDEHDPVDFGEPRRAHGQQQEMFE